MFVRAWAAWICRSASLTSVCCCGAVRCSSSLSEACVRRMCPWWWSSSLSPANCCSPNTSEPEVRHTASYWTVFKQGVWVQQTSVLFFICVCVCVFRSVSAVLCPVSDGSRRAVCPHHVPHLGGVWDLRTHPGPQRNRDPAGCRSGLTHHPRNHRSVFILCESYRLTVT